MKALWDLLQDNEELRAKYPEIAWQFNTPSAPHTGGIFERMIRSAKTAFYAIAKQKDLNDEELNTTFIIVEGILNSRPLTTVSNDPRDLSPLTPASFLKPGADGMQRDAAPVMVEPKHQERWHQLQKLMDEFWNRFCNEYTSRLQKYPKWLKERPELKVGDKVIVLENKARGFWPIGLIKQVFPGSDGLIRTVEVEFDKGSYVRPIHKVIPLKIDPIQLDEPQPVEVQAQK